MSGTLIYWAKDRENTIRSLRLTVCSEEDAGGIAEIRRKRLSRIISEAVNQGARLSYGDLSMIMLSSKATLKRDVCFMRKNGMEIMMGAR